jgi:ketosteroid isomerase-like protein
MAKIVLSIVIGAILFLSSCNKNGKDIEKIKDEIINTDKDFSVLSVQKGFQEAFLKYAADSVILLRQNNYPIIGKENLKKLYAGRSKPNIILSWEPLKADASPDGCLGYSYGKWQIMAKDSLGKEVTNYGVYVTVWEKQSDNSWKFVLDGGNDTPQDQ